VNRLSNRYLMPAAALLLVAAGAVGWLTQNPRRVDPCARPGALAVTSLIPGATHLRVKKQASTGSQVLWTEGTFTNPLSAEQPFHYQMVRSYSLLHQASRPVNLVSETIDAEHHRVVHVEAAGQQIPVHLVEDYTKQPHRLIAYFHIYGLEPSEQPLASHLGHFATVIGKGTPVLTTVVVDGVIHRKGLEVATEASLSWLVGSFEFFDRFCSDDRPTSDDDTPDS
jgi:hypothetical protein